MLSGEILSRAPLSVALLPPPSLIEICRAMAAIASLANQQNIDDDDDIFLENGLLSYENPNYHMDPQRMERNSHLYEEILSELHHQNTLKRNKQKMANNRKDYARMDLETMGAVDKFRSSDNKQSLLLFDDSPLIDNLNKCDKQQLLLLADKDESMGGVDLGNGIVDAIPSTQDSNKQNISNIQHMPGNLNSDDLYALPNKNSCYKNSKINNDSNSDEPEKGRKEEVDSIEDKDTDKDLPPGWEKHEDIDGAYYWHIKSGTIQREPPIWPKDLPKELKTPVSSTISNHFLNSVKYSSNQVVLLSSVTNLLNKDGQNMILSDPKTHSVTRSSTSSTLDQDERRRKEDLVYKRRSYPLKAEAERPIRFAVRSLGWVEIAEEDLTPERSSKAVNKCIVDLSLGRNDLLDVVGRWGDGKDLFMDLDEGALKLIDPENLTILNTQPIHTIRVWGVGRDNGRERDFAYVARDRLTRIHMCHVFRCDTAARTIANTLRDICKRIMIERSLQLDSSTGMTNGSRGAIRPTDLPTENRRWVRHPQSFPTPMEEPKKILKAQYLGSTEVCQAIGMDSLNIAIETVMRNTNPDKWENVNVSVAPSMISIHSFGEESRILAECRVRYLSFLGIGKNVKMCAFVMHTAQDKFIAHVFYCEPSSGALCKTIEAACKLRYQKCLDAHPETRNSSESLTPKGIGATIKNLMNTFTHKKEKLSS